MSKKWSREKRHKHIREKYYKKREKFLTIFFVTIIFIVLLTGLSFALQSANIILLTIFVILLMILLPFSIFVVDHIFFETE